MLPTRPFLLAGTALLSAAALAHPPLHNYKLDNVLWRLSVSLEKQAIAGSATNTVTLTEDADQVQFDAAELEILKVTVNGAPATFTYEDNLVTVALPQPGKRGLKLSVDIFYSGNPKRGFYFVSAERAFPAHTPMVYTQGEGEDNHYWLPTYDYPDNKATTECYVTVPKSWTAISNGALLGIAGSGPSHTFHWKMDKPYSTYLISLVAGPYKKGGNTWHGIPVDYYVPPGLEKEGRDSFLVTSKMIDFYSKLTGFNYPWPKFAQEVVGDFMFGGMENTSCVTQTIKTLHPANTEPLRDSTYLVAHELAHHWFGDTITCATWDHMWLNEGFATTLPAFFARETRGEDEFTFDRYNNFEGAINSIGSRNRKALDVTTGATAVPTMGSVYDGGCSRIMMLYHQLGDAIFWKGIHTFLEAYKFQPATTDEFFAVMSKVSGRDLTDFKKQWFFTAATPSVTVSFQGHDLVVNQLAPYYSLELPVWFLDGDTWVKKSLHLEGKETRLDVGGLAEKPFLVDPEMWTLMELHYAAPFLASDFMKLYRHAPNVGAKARLIVFQYASLPIQERLELLNAETFHSLRQLMVARLGKEGEPALVTLAQDKDSRVVDAALSALNGLNIAQTTLAQVQAIALGSPNEALREKATQVWLDKAGTAELAKKTWKRHAFDDGFRVMALNWFGKNEPNSARDLALAFLASPDSEPVRIAAIRVLGLVKEAPGSSDVFKVLAPIAQENSFGGTVAAINALAELGNKDALPILQALTEHGPGGVEGAAKNAIAKLNKQ